MTRFSWLILGVTACSFATTRTESQQPAPSQIFTFETNELWLNLHHFLHVLGRHEAGTPDSRRDAVMDAPKDERRGFARLGDEEQQRWREAVRFYRNGPSTKDLVFDRELAAATAKLGEANDAATLAGVAIDTSLARVLESVAPIYRKGWWEEHRSANEAWVTAARPLIAAHGEKVLTFITNAYGMQWPAAGYPVHMSAFTNWAGAYSTIGNLLVVSSLDTAARGAYGLETLFHEAMHQWDSPVFLQLREHSRSQGLLVPDGLTHVMIFWTAGEAVKRSISGHVPMAIQGGIYERRWSRLRDAVALHWQRYLDGRASKDEAMAALIKLTGVRRPPD